MQLNSKCTYAAHPAFLIAVTKYSVRTKKAQRIAYRGTFLFVSHSNIAEIEESGKLSKLSFFIFQMHTQQEQLQRMNMQIETAKIVVQLCVPSTCEFLPLPLGYLYLCFSVLSIISHWSCASIHRLLYTIAARGEGTRQVDNIARNELVVRFAHFSPIANVHIFNLFIFIQLCRVCVCAMCTRNDVEHFQYSYCIQCALLLFSCWFRMLPLSLVLVDFSIFIIICIYITAASRHCTRQTAQRAEL